MPGKGCQQQHRDKECDLGNIERLQPLLMRGHVKRVVNDIGHYDRCGQCNAGVWSDEQQQHGYRVEKREPAPEQTAWQAGGCSVAVVPEPAVFDDGM